MIKVVLVITMVLVAIIWLMWRNYISDEENWHEKEAKRREKENK